MDSYKYRDWKKIHFFMQQCGSDLQDKLAKWSFDRKRCFWIITTLIDLSAIPLLRVLMNRRINVNKVTPSVYYFVSQCGLCVEWLACERRRISGCRLRSQAIEWFMRGTPCSSLQLAVICYCVFGQDTRPSKCSLCPGPSCS